MYNEKEVLINKFGNELRAIAKAIDFSRLPRVEGQSDLDVLVNTLLPCLRKHGTLQKIRENQGTLNTTNYYLLAQVLSTGYIRTWEDFKVEVERKIPTYAKNKRSLLKLGGLPWKIHFNIPALRPHKPKIIQQPFIPKQEIPKETLKDCVTEIELLRKDLQETESRIINTIRNHIHIEGKTYKLTEI